LTVPVRAPLLAQGVPLKARDPLTELPAWVISPAPVVVNTNGPTLVAKPFVSTVAMDALVEDHLPEDAEIVFLVRLLYQP